VHVYVIFFWDKNIQKGSHTIVYTLCRLVELFLEYYLVEFQVSEGGWKEKKIREKHIQYYFSLTSTLFLSFSFQKLDRSYFTK